MPALFCGIIEIMKEVIAAERLGATANGKEVFLDYTNTNVEYHLLETPNLLALVREALPYIELQDADQVVIEKDMGRIVGTTNLVETAEGDEIVYAKRVDRQEYSRFVMHRQPVPCDRIVMVIRKTGNTFYLWTAMCGMLLPKEAYQADSRFSQTHAMVYDEDLIQIDSLTQSRPRS